MLDHICVIALRWKEIIIRIKWRRTDLEKGKSDALKKCLYPYSNNISKIIRIVFGFDDATAWRDNRDKHSINNNYYILEINADTCSGITPMVCTRNVKSRRIAIVRLVFYTYHHMWEIESCSICRYLPHCLRRDWKIGCVSLWKKINK